MTSEEFKQAHARTGLTQAELAKAMGVDVRTVRRWENDERPVPGIAEALIKLLRKTSQPPS